ncbi:acyltransferase [Loktanella salsilacus]|uniref:acyltransferase n=1 Tax=Loktanella salsilacus TaxID=195913 RepID=UPI0030FAE526
MTQYRTSFALDIRDMAARMVVRGIFALHRLIPGNPGNPTKNKIQRWILAHLSISIGARSQISPGFFVFQRGKFSCGTNCRLGYDFSVWNHSPFTVGDDLLASHGVKAICGTHATDTARTDISGPIKIGNNVWIGANVIIVGPCTIGDNVIIGANSFVTGYVAPESIIGGSPARVLRRNANANSGSLT